MITRKKFAYLVIFLMTFLSILKLTILQEIFLSEDEKAKNYEYSKVIKAKRGNILTNDNLEIALDLEYQSMAIDPTLFVNVEEIDKFINILSNNLNGIDEKKIKSEILTRKEKKIRIYDFNKMLITSIQKDAIESAMIKAKKENKGLFKNRILYFNREFRRKYIDNKVFETIVGYLNNENKGVYGLEHKYEDYLRGENGLSKGTRAFSPNLAEYTLPYLTDEKIIEEPKDGNSLILSIDSIFQYALDEILEKSYENFTPVSSMGIVMEVDTGRIIAMGSYPKADSKANIKNYNITSLFEPGSIFKPITIAAAINEGKINENTLISSEGYIRVKNRIIRDHDDSTKGTMTVSKIIAHSGNVGLVKISQLLDPKVFYDYLSKFGLGEKTEIDTSYESSSKLMSFKNFTEVRRSNISFGQGINMTQLQIMVALNAAINGGKVVVPRIVDKIVSKDGKIVKEFETVVKKQAINENTSKKIRDMLEDVVNSGTGKGIKLEGYRIGGKTGTAQKAGANGYEAGKYFSSFYTFFPVENPKYAILITVDEPQGAHYGASVALPSAREMLEKIIKNKNILPENSVDVNEEKVEKENKINRNNKLDTINHELSLNLMPDLTGITRKNILNIENLSKYKVQIIGNGKVVKQIPEAGSVLKDNTLIRLELK